MNIGEIIVLGLAVGSIGVILSLTSSVLIAKIVASYRKQREKNNKLINKILKK